MTSSNSSKYWAGLVIQYSLPVSQQTVGVIYRVERDSFRVLDQNGQVRLVQPHQITMRKDSRRVISTDANGHELRVGDNVKETDGEVDSPARIRK
jgi:transcription elongation factor